MGHAELQPDVYVYTMLVHVLAKSGNGHAAAQADFFLLMMENERRQGNWRTGADRISWNSVIHAWAQSNAPDEAKHARSILDPLT